MYFPILPTERNFPSFICEGKRKVTGPASSPAAPTPSVPQGTWRGRLDCGPRIPPEPGRADAEPFSDDIGVDVAGARIAWLRNRARFIDNVDGRFDARGHFSASGKGSYKDGSGEWGIRARGAFLPQAGRIEGSVQVLRSGDGAVARECTLRAEPP